MTIHQHKKKNKIKISKLFKLLHVQSVCQVKPQVWHNKIFKKDEIKNLLLYLSFENNTLGVFLAALQVYLEHIKWL
jgi:hypothetical protein